MCIRDREPESEAVREPGEDLGGDPVPEAEPECEPDEGVLVVLEDKHTGLRELAELLAENESPGVAAAAREFQRRRGW